MSEKNEGTFPLCGCVKTYIDVRDKHEHCYIHNLDYLHCIWCNAYKRQKESELSSVSPQPTSDALAEVGKQLGRIADNREEGNQSSLMYPLISDLINTLQPVGKFFAHLNRGDVRLDVTYWQKFADGNSNRTEFTNRIKSIQFVIQESEGN